MQLPSSSEHSAEADTLSKVDGIMEEGLCRGALFDLSKIYQSRYDSQTLSPSEPRSGPQILECRHLCPGSSAPQEVVIAGVLDSRETASGVRHVPLGGAAFPVAGRPHLACTVPGLGLTRCRPMFLQRNRNRRHCTGLAHQGTRRTPVLAKRTEKANAAVAGTISVPGVELTLIYGPKREQSNV
jgi:hypothetical protein